MTHTDKIAAIREYLAEAEDSLADFADIPRLRAETEAGIAEARRQLAALDAEPVALHRIGWKVTETGPDREDVAHVYGGSSFGLTLEDLYGEDAYPEA